jgi:hypothetical protein
VRWLSLVERPIDGPEAEVAAGEQGAHAERLGQGLGLTIRRFSSLTVRRQTACCDLGVKPERLPLRTRFLELARQR